MSQLTAVVAIVFTALFIGGCVSTQATLMSANTVKVDVSSSPSCAGRTNEFMMQRAGVETIRRGFDKYILLDHGTGSIITGVNQYGSVSRSGTGSVVVKMFMDGDPTGANALSARELLGANWQQMVDNKIKTSCL